MDTFSCIHVMWGHFLMYTCHVGTLSHVYMSCGDTFSCIPVMWGHFLMYTCHVGTLSHVYL